MEDLRPYPEEKVIVSEECSKSYISQESSISISSETELKKLPNMNTVMLDKMTAISSYYHARSLKGILLGGLNPLSFTRKER